MYLDSKDYQTVWQLAHNWVGNDPNHSDTDALSIELRETIHRLMHAALNQLVSARTRNRAFFLDDSFFSTLFDLRHTARFLKCLRKDAFDKTYLDSIYLKRSDVLRWCQNEFLEPPPLWAPPSPASSPNSTDDAIDDEDDGWYSTLTTKRKQRVACLEMAKTLWKINPNWMYEEVYTHPIMKQYGNPKVFTLASFKKWSREFAPESAKTAGRRKDSGS